MRPLRQLNLSMDLLAYFDRVFRSSSCFIQSVLRNQNASYIHQAVSDSAFVANLLRTCHSLVISRASVGESALCKENLSNIQRRNPFAKPVADSTKYFESLLLYLECARRIPHPEHDVSNVVEVAGYSPFILQLASRSSILKP